MRDDRGAAEPAGGEPGSPDDPDEEAWVPLEGLSDEGLLLLFAGLACLLAALTAASRGQPQPAVVFGGVAGAVAFLGFAVDLLSGFVPAQWVHLLVGGGAAVAAAFAFIGGHLVNAATFGAAAALVLWRVVDVEFRGAE